MGVGFLAVCRNMTGVLACLLFFTFCIAWALFGVGGVAMELADRLGPDEEEPMLAGDLRMP